MPNAIDYLDWRGDIPLDFDGFNEVDGLIVSKLTSLDFTGIVPEDGSMRFADALGEYFKRFGEEDRRLGVLLPAGTVTMAKKLLASRRFAGLVIADYVNHVDDAAAEQFCALTALLPDGSRFAAFRGTDDNHRAWREDFNMSAEEAVPAQLDAAAYLERELRAFDGTMRLRRHSKGGNLAVYAAMRARRSSRSASARSITTTARASASPCAATPATRASGAAYARSYRSTPWSASCSRTTRAIR